MVGTVVGMVVITVVITAHKHITDLDSNKPNASDDDTLIILLFI